jgi:hypothetical protein
MIKRAWMMAFLFALPVCGDGKKANSFTSGVPQEKPMSTLTSADATSYCTSLWDFVKAHRASECLLDAYDAMDEGGPLDDASARSICQAAYTDCMDEELDVSECVDAYSGSTCVATIGQMTRCQNDFMATVEGYAAKLPGCSSVTVAGLATLPDEPEAPASCMAIPNNCM